MKKIIVGFLLVSISTTGFTQHSTSNISVANSNEIRHFEIGSGHHFSMPEISELVEPDSIIRKPVVAFIGSFLIPGAGQFYNNQVVKGIVMLGISSVTLAKLALTRSDSYWFFYEDNKQKQDFKVLLAIVTSLWSMIDAPISANKLNKENGVTFNISPSFQQQTNYLTNRSQLSFGPKVTLSF